MGQIYVDVTAAQAELGISTLDTSGGGMQTGGAWLTWTDSGFTGNGWYWNDPNNYLQKGWAAAVKAGGGYVNECNGNENGTPHTESYEDFLYHVSQRHSDNLNSILGDWGTKEKTYFITSYSELEESGCVVWQ